MMIYPIVPYKIRVVATDKKIGGLDPAGLWRLSGVTGGALPVHTDAVFTAVFGAVYCEYSCSFVKS